MGREKAANVKCWFCKELNSELEKASYQWEVDHSTEYELWEDETPENLTLIERAGEPTIESRPEAIALLEQATKQGSAIAPQRLAWHYSTGTGAPVDKERAWHFYREASARGSWMATTEYARLCAAFGDDTEAERMFRQGMAAEFLPAFYWMAKHHYGKSSDRQTIALITPWLERAVDAGHPRAKLMQGRLYAWGKYGWRNIPKGFRILIDLASEYNSKTGEAELTD